MSDENNHQSPCDAAPVDIDSDEFDLPAWIQILACFGLSLLLFAALMLFGACIGLAVRCLT